jgi:hypothetical protein
MAGLQVVTEAADYPVSLTRVKDHLRLSDQTDDTLVRSLIIAATKQVEEMAQRTLMNTTYSLFIDYVHETDYSLWEGTRVGPDIAYRQNFIELPRAPLVSVTHVKSYDDSDTATTFDSSKYFVDTANTPPRIVLRDGQSWPTGLRAANGLEIQYVAGYGSNDTDVPEPIRLAIMQIITANYENRGDEEAKMPSMVNSLIAPYKVLSLNSTPFNNIVQKVW